MNWKSFFKKILVFSITLSFGLLVVEFYSHSDKEETRIEVISPQINQTTITSKSKTSASKHYQCIEFRNKNLSREKLIRDMDEIENLLKNSDAVSRKKAKNLLEKLERNQDKHRRRKNVEAILSSQKKSNGVHKLLYIENCIKYSE